MYNYQPEGCFYPQSVFLLLENRNGLILRSVQSKINTKSNLCPCGFYTEEYANEVLQGNVICICYGSRCEVGLHIWLPTCSEFNMPAVNI
jgi:hypothetical protein